MQHNRRAVDFMRRCKRQMMITINDHSDIRWVFVGFHMECLDIRYSNTNQWPGSGESLAN